MCKVETGESQEVDFKGDCERGTLSSILNFLVSGANQLVFSNNGIRYGRLTCSSKGGERGGTDSSSDVMFMSKVEQVNPGMLILRMIMDEEQIVHFSTSFKHAS